MTTTLGRELVREALPDGYKDYADVPLDESTMAELATKLATTDSGRYINVIARLNDIGREVAYRHGRDASLSIKDISLPPEAARARAEFQAKIKGVLDDRGMSSDSKERLMAKLTEDFFSKWGPKVFTDARRKGSAFARQIESGSRGSKRQLTQILLGHGMVAGPDGLVPYPVATGFAQGLSPFEYWLDSLQAKKALADTQLATADAGYFSRMLSNASHRLVVTKDDCGTSNGIRVEGGDPDNVGAVLAADAGPFKAGTALTDKHLAALSGKKIRVRSPMACEAEDGVCSKCAGVREDGRLPEIGYALGTNASKALAEMSTQLALNSKHVGAKTEEPVLESVKRYFNVPKNFVGGAVLSTSDGRVKAVKKAPQGGWDVIIGTGRQHIPSELKPAVKPGDAVERGDELSTGMVNPSAVASLRGLGSARKALMDDLAKTLKGAGARLNRRNLEALARGFVSRIRVESPDALPGALPGDVMDYSVVAANWKPRRDSVLKSPSAAVNLYLERPYLHHTVGTRVTKRVAKELKDAGVGKILAHRTPPPFEPEVTRAQDFLGSDPDWTTRLMGENLKRNVLDAVRMGSVSDPKSTSYVPRLVFGKSAPDVKGV